MDDIKDVLKAVAAGVIILIIERVGQLLSRKDRK